MRETRAGYNHRLTGPAQIELAARHLQEDVRRQYTSMYVSRLDTFAESRDEVLGIDRAHGVWRRCVARADGAAKGKCVKETKVDANSNETWRDNTTVSARCNADNASSSCQRSGLVKRLCRVLAWGFRKKANTKKHLCGSHRDEHRGGDGRYRQYVQQQSQVRVRCNKEIDEAARFDALQLPAEPRVGAVQTVTCQKCTRDESPSLNLCGGKQGDAIRTTDTDLRVARLLYESERQMS